MFYFVESLKSYFYDLKKKIKFDNKAAFLISKNITLSQCSLNVEINRFLKNQFSTLKLKFKPLNITKCL